MMAEGKVKAPSPMTNGGPKVKPMPRKQAAVISTSTKAALPVKKGQSAFGQLLDAVTAECRRLGIWDEELQRDLPKRWEKHGDLVLLPHDSFTNIIWRIHGRSLWAVVAKSMNASRLARKKRLQLDDPRHTYVELLFGDHGWVQHQDGGVTYNYDVVKCLYSGESAAERLRIQAMPIGTDIVCDLFAGIGYLTLAALLGGAKRVFAVDWDPEILEALRRNVEANGVGERCTVLEGDCRKVAPQAQCDRVILSLLPSSKAYILAACKALKPQGGWLHIHDTLPSSAASSAAPSAAPGAQPKPVAARPAKAPLQRQMTAPSVTIQKSLTPPPDKNVKSKSPKVSPNASPKPKAKSLAAKKNTDGADNITPVKKASPKSKSPTPEKDAKDKSEIKKNAANKITNSTDKVKTLSKSPSPEPNTPATKSPAKKAVGAGKSTKSTTKAKTPPKMAVVKEDEESTDTKSQLSLKIPKSPCKSPSPSPKKSGSSPRVEIPDGDSGIETEASADSGDGPPEGPSSARRKLSRSASIMEEMLSRLPSEPTLESGWAAAPPNPLWAQWSLDSARRVTGYLDNLHDDVTWQVSVCRLGRVAAYTPKLDHVVLDLLCKPVAH